ELPEVGEFKKWSSAEIQKIKKGKKIDKPELQYTNHIEPSNLWTQPLLKNMFHTGTVNSNQKLSAQQMCEELLQCVQHGELEESDVPKVTTIQNWITKFSCKWKGAMAICSLELAESSKMVQ
ncbi:10531_t:CDS:2, partial [Cetraspora pellucida]